MRAISPHPDYSICLHHGTEAPASDFRGNVYTRTVDEPIIANFEPGGLFPHEVDLALKHFQQEFKALPEGTSPLTRLSVYDLEAHSVREGWSEERLAYAEERLRHLARVNTSQFILVEAILPKPWGRYDEATPDLIVEYVSELGLDPVAVRAYEQSTRNRADVIEGLNSLIDQAEGSVVEGISVPAA